MIEVKLPSLGADMDKGTLIEWCVHPGAAVKKGDILAIIDTTKAALDVESWHDGTVLDLLLEPGQTVVVGTPMVRLLEPGEDPAAARAAMTAAAVAAAATAMPAAAQTPAPAVAAAPSAPPLRRQISPAARRRAAELGLALDAVTGSGPNGVVTLKDVEDAGAGPVPAPAPAPAPVPAPGSVPAPGPAPALPQDRSAAMRRTIAAAMSRSKREIPHYYLSDDVPLGAASEWLRRTNQERPIAERLLMAALFVRALACAARKHPLFNGFYVDDQFRPSAAVNVGMAVALRGGGLIAPAIHGAERLSLPQIMRALVDLVARTRAGKLRRDELVDPTITLTNLGDQSVTAVHGVIYAPQVALVGCGEVRERAWAAAGKIVPMPAVTITLAADHRVSDGHAGARFLAEIGRQLQNPESL